MTYREDFTLPAEIMEQVQAQGPWLSQEREKGVVRRAKASEG